MFVFKKMFLVFLTVLFISCAGPKTEAKSQQSTEVVNKAEEIDQDNNSLGSGPNNYQLSSSEPKGEKETAEKEAKLTEIPSNHQPSYKEKETPKEDMAKNPGISTNGYEMPFVASPDNLYDGIIDYLSDNKYKLLTALGFGVTAAGFYYYKKNKKESKINPKSASVNAKHISESKPNNKSRLDYSNRGSNGYFCYKTFNADSFYTAINNHRSRINYKIIHQFLINFLKDSKIEIPSSFRVLEILNAKKAVFFNNPPVELQSESGVFYSRYYESNMLEMGNVTVFVKGNVAVLFTISETKIANGDLYICFNGNKLKEEGKSSINPGDVDTLLQNENLEVYNITLIEPKSDIFYIDNAIESNPSKNILKIDVSENYDPEPIILEENFKSDEKSYHYQGDFLIQKLHDFEFVAEISRNFLQLSVEDQHSILNNISLESTNTVVPYFSLKNLRSLLKFPAFKLNLTTGSAYAVIGLLLSKTATADDEFYENLDLSNLKQILISLIQTAVYVDDLAEYRMDDYGNIIKSKTDQIVSFMDKIYKMDLMKFFIRIDKYLIID